jgi:sirohydrochlorin ferrochelatase
MENKSVGRFLIRWKFLTFVEEHMQNHFVNRSVRALLYLMVFCPFVIFCEQLHGKSAPSSQTGILIMAHGGTPEWNAAVQEAITTLQLYCPVVVAFGMAEQTSLQQGVAELEAAGVRQIAVVRLFISGASFLHQTEYLLGLRPDPPAQFIQHHHGAQPAPGAGGSHHADHSNAHASAGAQAVDPHHGHHSTGDARDGSAELPVPIKTSAQIVLSQPGLMDSDLIAEILRDRVKKISVLPAQESVLLLAHGAGEDGENDQIIAQIKRLAQDIEKLGKFRAIGVETLREDWPEKRVHAEKKIRDFVTIGNQNGGRVLVVPFRLYGFGPYAKVLEGLQYVSDEKGLLPHPIIGKWMQSQAEICIRQAGWQNPFTATEAASQ